MGKSVKQFRVKDNSLAVQNIVINHRFWLGLEDYLKVFEPILKVLIFISRKFIQHMKERYLRRLQTDRVLTLDRHWDIHYKSPLIKVRFFPNPNIYKMQRYEILHTIIYHHIWNLSNLVTENHHMNTINTRSFLNCMEKMISNLRGSNKKLEDLEKK